MAVYVASRSGAFDRIDQSLHWCKLERYDEVIRYFKVDSVAMAENATTSYLVGFAYFRLHNFEAAKPLLEKAVGAGFNGYPGWLQATDILTNIQKLESLAPHHYEDLKVEQSPKMRIFCNKTEWMKPVLVVLPSFLSRAEEMFKEDLPPIDLYFFSSREDFNTFFKLAFERDVGRAWQNGTGNSNIVVFCEKDENGNPLAINTNRTLGDILHEYGHAICTTIYGSNYLRAVPQWFNEGCADAVAAPYYGDLFKTYQKRLVTAGLDSRPPTYDELCKKLYDDPYVRYAFASLMVQDLVIKNGTKVVRKIVVRAKRRQDFERAIREITGEDSQALYRRVRGKFWRAT
jgi:hypothetical protein